MTKVAAHVRRILRRMLMRFLVAARGGPCRHAALEDPSLRRRQGVPPVPRCTPVDHYRNLRRSSAFRLPNTQRGPARAHGLGSRLHPAPFVSVWLCAFRTPHLPLCRSGRRPRVRPFLLTCVRRRPPVWAAGPRVLPPP